MKTRFIEFPEKYILRAWDDVFVFVCEIKKKADWKFTADFETTYKTSFNTFESNVAGAFTTTQTNTVLLNPTDGKRFALESYFLNVRNGTLGAQTLQVFDGANSGNNRIINISIAADSELTLASKDLFISAAVDNNLQLTSSGGIIINGRFKAYEVF